MKLGCGWAGGHEAILKAILSLSLSLSFPPPPLSLSLSLLPSLSLSPTIIVDSFCLDNLTVLSNSSYLNLDIGVNDLSLLAASRLGQLLTTDHLWIQHRQEIRLSSSY